MPLCEKCLQTSKRFVLFEAKYNDPIYSDLLNIFKAGINPFWMS